MKIDDKGCFEEVVETAGRVNANKVCFTEKALERAVATWNDSKVPEYGVVYRPQLTIPISLSDVAFEISELRCDSGSLIARCRMLDTPSGKFVRGLLKIDPEAATLAMCVSVADDKQVVQDGVTTVTEFTLERISIVRVEEKA